VVRDKAQGRGTKNAGRRSIKITGADHTNWQVRDLERSLGFYRDVLGLELFGLEKFNRCVVGAPVTPTLKSPRLSRTKVASS
jgi:hypothetical protein